MKNFVFILMIAVFLSLTFCKKDDEITATVPPSVSFISDDFGFQTGNTISGAKGKTMTVRAELKDEVGIQSFRVFYPEWELDNTVNVSEYYPGEALHTYLLEYNFLVPEDADDSKNHNMSLVVMNLGGLTTESEIIVLMDGDYDAPVISNEYPGNNATVPGEDLHLSFDVTDNIGLAYVVVEFPAFNFYDSISEFENPKELSYYKNINVRDWESYEYSIRAADGFSNQDMKIIKFNVGTPGITHMFLVDKSTQEELDKGLIGTTIKMDPTAIENEHSVVYYCTEPGTEIRFMENFNSFSGANYLYGVDENTLIEGGMDQPLIINEKGYYWISINTDELTFSIDGPVSPNDLTDARTVPSSPWFFGRGVDGNLGGWDTYSDYSVVDPENIYLFYLELQLGDAENDGYCEGCIGMELNGNTEWNDEYVWDDIVWFGYQWYQDGVIDDIDENGGKPEGWAGLAGQWETWSDEEENYWNVWTDMSAIYEVTIDMYTGQTRIFKK